MESLIRKSLNVRKKEKIISEAEWSSIEFSFREIVNSKGVDNAFDTQDYILARYLVLCLKSFHWTISMRDEFGSEETTSTTKGNNNG